MICANKEYAETIDNCYILMHFCFEKGSESENEVKVQQKENSTNCKHAQL